MGRQGSHIPKPSREEMRQKVLEYIASPQSGFTQQEKANPERTYKHLIMRRVPITRFRGYTELVEFIEAERRGRWKASGGRVPDSIKKESSFDLP